jgi:hypothetical protein
MSNPQLAQEWRERLEDYAHSEMTVQEWCEYNGVSKHQYFYWRRRLAGAAPKTGANPGWQVVDILDTSPIPSAKASLNVHIAGAAIEVGPGFDPALLRAVVAALATPSC